MNLPEAMSLFQTQIPNMDTLWAYFSSTTLAVLGFTIAAEKATRSRLEIVIIQLGYFVFAMGNLFAIYTSQQVLYNLAALIISIEGDTDLVSAFEAWKVCVFQFSITLVVLISIEATYRYNRALQRTSH